MPQPVIDGRVDPVRALRLRMKGQSYRQIANEFGVTKQAVEQRLSSLKTVLNDPDLTNAYANHEAEILDAGRKLILPEILDKHKLKKASSRDLAVTYGVLFDKSRVLRGLATSIIDYTNVSNETQKLMQRQKDLEAALELVQDSEGTYK